MRRLVAALAGVALGAWAGPAAAEEVTLEVAPRVASYGASVHLAGAVTPARQTTIGIYRQRSGTWQLVDEAESRADGRYSLAIAGRRPGLYVARTDAAESTPARVRIRPTLTTSFSGLRVVGAPFRLRGRLRPALAGTLTLIVRGRARHVALDGRGRFREAVPTRRAGKVGLRLRLYGENGFAGLDRRLRKRVLAPRLGLGARGRAVRFLQQRLADLRYVLRDVDRAFHWDTLEAVYAFQKVERLSRSGVVTPGVWRELRRARTPRAAVERGSHIEVDKARQVLFEVRRGRVVRIVHISTGATGNTPIGRWRVYRKTPGFNSLGMYYSMYFLGGFAVHGYHSVPPWPASHGCVRMPNWFAPRLYARWPYASTIWVLPTTARRSPLWTSPATIRGTAPLRTLGAIGP
jgi:L,D-transpeptidase catalytic domain/Putative peptidoglycan binding domain